MKKSTMQRLKPDPVPAVYPLWEYKADGDLRDAYEAYKKTMQIPWVGVVTMAYAHYRTFFDTWWQAMEPVVGSQTYVDSAFALKQQVETRIANLNPPPITQRLLALGYSERELAEIRDMIDVITHGNFMQIPAVFSARLLLEGEPLIGNTTIGKKAKSHHMQVDTPFILMEPHHGLGDIHTLYSDVKATLGLPFVNTDYRCFSRWPSYFDMAWKDLRDLISTSHYESFVGDIHETIVETARQLPNPTHITPEALQEAAAKDGNMEQVLKTTRLFSWLLPGLVTNVAYFRAQLLS